MVNQIKNKLNNSTFLRFAIAGAISTILDFGGFSLLVALSFSPIFSNYISTGVAFCFSFIANKKYTFKTKGNSLKREMLLFIIVTLFGLWAIQPFIIWIVIHHIAPVSMQHSNILPFIAKLIATLFSLTWNYILYSRVVFVEKPKDKNKQS